MDTPPDELTAVCLTIADQFDRHPLMLVKRALELSQIKSRSVKTNIWSELEMQKLRDIQHTIPETKNWRGWIDIACEFEGKSAQEVRRKYHQLADQNVTKGEWSKEEDIRLLVGVKVFGTCYA